MNDSSSEPVASASRHEGTGVEVYDLTGRGTLRVGGKDRAEFLQGLVTNDVKKLTPGSGCYATLLTPKGKLLADLTVLCGADVLTLDCEGELSAKLDGLLRRYHFYHQVEIHDVTAEWAVLHLAGAEAFSVLKGLTAVEPPKAPHAHREARLEGAVTLLVSEGRTGSPGWDIRLRRDAAPGVIHALEKAGIVATSPEALESARIDAGIPRWGFELLESVLPNEARLEQTAISYTKGCYIGQETVARIKTYGHVNRLLVRIQPDGPVERGADVLAEAETVGSITSAAFSARLARHVALAYVRCEHAEPGTRLAVVSTGRSVPAVVAPFPR